MDGEVMTGLQFAQRCAGLRRLSKRCATLTLRKPLRSVRRVAGFIKGACATLRTLRKN
jgi:hypothetical protein